ncbi:hypothetical protein LLP35_12405, partial [Ruminococcus albus]|nr:hypothetical protein [Ruminococcus albus]
MNRKTIGKKEILLFFLGRFVPLLHLISDKYVSHAKLSIYLMKKSIYVGLSIILDTIIKKFDRRKPFEGTHRTVV